MSSVSSKVLIQYFKLMLHLVKLSNATFPVYQQMSSILKTQWFHNSSYVTWTNIVRSTRNTYFRTQNKQFWKMTLNNVVWEWQTPIFLYWTKKLRLLTIKFLYLLCSKMFGLNLTISRTHRISVIHTYICSSTSKLK